MSIGTRLFTWLHGGLVGTDEFGNRYYRDRHVHKHRRERRWVLYNGEAEASRVPPEWHAWLHRIIKDPPSQTPLVQRPWQKPHLPNLTGSALAYRPPGHTLQGGQRARGTGDYEPWIPS